LKKIIVSSLISIMAVATVHAADCIMAKELDVHFKNDSTIYSDASEMQEIKIYADFLIETDLYAVVEGHTNSLAEARYNYDLSSRRAIKVRDELIKLGVDKDKVSAMGFGETTPLYDNNTTLGQAQNRRVVGEVFNDEIEVLNYLNNAKSRIADIKYKER